MRTKTNIYHAPDHSREKQLEGSPLASFTRRAVAFLIDFFIAGILLGTVIYMLLRNPFLAGIIAPDPDADINFGFFDNWYSVIWLVTYFTLMLYFTRGRSLGKWICRIRVVSLVHRRISLWHCFERSLGYGASALEAGFGFFQYFIRTDRRTIHDRIAETLVIREPPKKKSPKPGKKKSKKTEAE